MQSELVVDPRRQLLEQRVARPILIIEDDEAAGEVLATRLRRQGYQALWSKTGRGGLMLAQSERPNLVLLDIRLPDADGFDVCRMLDEDTATCDIPVIMVSGMEGPDIVRRARAAGCRYYMRKPYDPDALLILIERAIDEALQPEW